MKSLRRINIRGAKYFITMVTLNREPLLLKNTTIFWNSWRDIRPEVWVILPDHIHIIIEPQDDAISSIIHNFKIRYSRRFRNLYRAGRVWQNRFWDHVIRDEMIGGLQDYLGNDLYERNWGVIDKPSIEGEFGE
ncbi:MAG: transposase [candidate division Zixibacteria bacterium]|nr:transposase [candidate division Zixibacteria bacterium]